MSVIPPPLFYGVTATIALALAGWSGADALSRSARNTAPGFAHKVAPWNAGSRAALGAAMLTQTGEPVDGGRARYLALKAIEGGEVSAAAVRTAGLAESLGGENPRSGRLMELAERLSRRDLLTQIWFIEHYSAAGDVRRTLDHYEIALTTSSSSIQLLYPVLVGAATDPELTPEIANFMVRNRERSWWGPMMTALIGETADPRSAAQIATVVLKPGVADDLALARTAVGRLVAVNALDEAHRLYVVMTGNRQSEGRIKDGGFDREPRLPPLDWAFAEEGGYRSQRGPAPAGSSGNALWIDAEATTRAVVATQILSLTPGSHHFSALIGAEEGPADRRLIFVLGCATKASGDQLVELPLPTGGGVRKVQGNYSITPDCPWQRFSVQVSGAQANTWVDDIAIR